MAFNIFKLDIEKDNQESRFRVVLEDENIDVIVSRKNVRFCFEGLGFSSHRIGSVLRLINKKYPIDLKKYRVVSEERYSDDELIEYLSFFGFRVKKRDDRLDLNKALSLIEERGYEVRGSVEGMPYSSPVVYKN